MDRRGDRGQDQREFKSPFTQRLRDSCRSACGNAAERTRFACDVSDQPIVAVARVEVARSALTYAGLWLVHFWPAPLKVGAHVCRVTARSFLAGALERVKSSYGGRPRRSAWNANVSVPLPQG
jgi:hypothetical protein